MKSAAIGYGDFVWTKGWGFPLSQRPMCDSRDVVLLITIPRETQAMRVRSK